jgi:REP element-mobilizing transposase RayT
MPNHLHLFVRLSGQLLLSRCVARAKAKTKSSLEAEGLSWQTNFYEHRLRPDDSAADVIRYLFLNPFRAGITPQGQRYRWFWLGAPEVEWFEPATDLGRPFPAWLH